MNVRLDISTNDDLASLERQVADLTEKCHQLETEREEAITQLQTIQLMSTDQIEKLCTLERKQDFLEEENRGNREKLLVTENEYNKLTNQYAALERTKNQMQECNKLLLKSINDKEESLIKYQSMIDVGDKTQDLDEKIEKLEEHLKEMSSEKEQLQARFDEQMSDHYKDIENIRDAYKEEKDKLDTQLSKLKSSLNKIQEENEKVNVEKEQLEEKLNKITELDYEDVTDQLRLEIKQQKALLKNVEASNDKVFKQLKSQLEDVENEKTAVQRQKKTLELDIVDLQEKLEDMKSESRVLEHKYEDAARENNLLNNQLKDSEEELEEILSKYKSSITTLTAHQNSLQNQATIIAELENQNINLTDKIEELQKKISHMNDASEEFDSKKFELKLSELEHKLGLELASKTRLENQVEKMKDKLEDAEKSQEMTKTNIANQEDLNRRLSVQIKDLKEDIVTLQIREMDSNEKRNISEKKLEIAEAEIISVRSQLELANRRVEDLQLALNCDTESENSSLPFSDGYQDDLDMFLINHRRRMAEQKEEERKIRENLLNKDNKAESDC